LRLTEVLNFYVIVDLIAGQVILERILQLRSRCHVDSGQRPELSWERKERMTMVSAEVRLE
jgi:hypothetical protein